MKDKVIKLLLAICLMIPFFVFNPIYASQKAVITFDNDTYLTNAVADVYKVGTYSLNSQGNPVVTLSGGFVGKFTEDLELKDDATVYSFVNRCAKAIKENTITPAFSAIDVKNGSFDTTVGDAYVILVRTSEQQKADLDLGEDNNYITKVKHTYFSYEFKPMLYMDGIREDSDPDPTIPCKFVRTPKTGELVIEKILTSYRQSKPVSFVFKITKIKDVDGKDVNEEIDVVALTFTQAGKKKLLVSNIPVGITVKVEEVYAGAGYAISGSNVDTTLIKQESKNKGQATYEESKVTFKNELNNEIKGYGVSNTFVKKDTGWDYKGNNLETGGTNE